MRALPAEDKAKIEQLTEGLRLEKKKLERELTKWDESGNDIIILAKKMCMMMMEMSDFTRLGLSLFSLKLLVIVIGPSAVQFGEYSGELFLNRTSRKREANHFRYRSSMNASEIMIYTTTDI